MQSTTSEGPGFRRLIGRAGSRIAIVMGVIASLISFYQFADDPPTPYYSGDLTDESYRSVVSGFWGFLRDNEDNVVQIDVAATPAYALDMQQTSDGQVTELALKGGKVGDDDVLCAKVTLRIPVVEGTAHRVKFLALNLIQINGHFAVEDVGARQWGCWATIRAVRAEDV